MRWSAISAFRRSAYSHASFFAAFKALGIKEPIKGHGRLLASLADAAA